MRTPKPWEKLANRQNLSFDFRALNRFLQKDKLSDVHGITLTSDDTSALFDVLQERFKITCKERTQPW
jgi:hypothetical protein